MTEPLTIPQRGDWNNFVSYLDLHGKSVNDSDAGEYLKGYNKDNPNSTISEEHIPIAKSEISNIKNGIPIGKMTQDHADFLSSSLSDKYKNNQNNFNYPVSKELGHDLETYSGGGGSKKPIPKPDFNNQAAVQNYRNALYKKYGAYIKERADLPEHLDTQVEGANDSFRNLSTKSAKKFGLKPELLYSSAMEEGMRGLIPTKANKSQTDYSGNSKYPISGFVNFGLDRFSDMFPDLVRRGYLSKDFSKNFIKSVETLGKDEAGAGQKVNSAYFKNVDSALEAKAAVLKKTSDDLSQFASQNKIELSDKAKDFFTLVAYNSGFGNAQKMLKSYFQKGYLNGDKFLEKQPDSSWKAPYDNAMKRIKASEMLKKEGYF